MCAKAIIKQSMRGKVETSEWDATPIACNFPWVHWSQRWLPKQACLSFEFPLNSTKTISLFLNCFCKIQNFINILDLLNTLNSAKYVIGHPSVFKFTPLLKYSFNWEARGHKFTVFFFSTTGLKIRTKMRYIGNILQMTQTINHLFCSAATIMTS